MSAQRKSQWALLAGLLLVLVGSLLLLRWGGHVGTAGDTAGRAAVGDAGEGQAAAAAQAPDVPAVDAEAIREAAVEPAGIASEAATSLLVRVTWASDGQPAAGVALAILFWDGPEPRRYAREVLTDERGEWFAAHVPAGRISAYADRGGSAGLTLRAGAVGELDLAIPAGVFVRGGVTDPQGVAVPRADIWLSDSGNSALGQVVARADDAGRFELRDVEASGHHIGARASGHSPSGRQAVEGTPGNVVDVVLILGDAAGDVRGRVLDPDRRPVAGALVQIGNDFGLGPPPVRTGEPLLGPACIRVRSGPDGAFLAEGVPARVLWIRAVAEGWSPDQDSIDVVAGEPVDVTLSLELSAHLAGTVRDGEGRPIEGAQISIGSRGELLASEAESDAEGRYELVDVALGSRQVTARHPLFGEATTGLIFHSGHRETWDPVLDRGAIISGTLLDASGAPAAGLRVESRAIDEATRGRSQSRTDASGRFELANVPPGPQRLIARGGSLGSLELEVAAPVEPGTRDLVLRLPQDFQELSHVGGRLVDGRGAPLAGEVWFRNIATDASWKARADAGTGRFEAGPLPLGRYEAEVQADGRPEHSFPNVEVPPGTTIDVGDLVVPGGGRIVAQLTAPGPLAESFELGTFVFCRAADAGTGGALQPAGGSWASQPLMPGPYVLVVRTRDYAAQQRKVLVEEGRDTEVHVNLLAGVKQSLRFFATPASGTGDIPLTFVVRTPAGEVVWDVLNGTLPALVGPAPATDSPLLVFGVVLEPGTYRIDVMLGDRTLTAETRTTDASVPWDFDLR